MFNHKGRPDRYSCPYCRFSTACPADKPQSHQRPHDDEWEPLRPHHRRVEGMIVEQIGGWRKRHPHDDEGEQDD